MAAPLDNLQDRFQMFTTDAIDRDPHQGHLGRDRNLDRALHVSRQEDAMLGWANLFAHVVNNGLSDYPKVIRHD